jgi:hypothetical protein
MVANFKAVGEIQGQTWCWIPKVNITGDGNVNFADESLHLDWYRSRRVSFGHSCAAIRHGHVNLSEQT